MSNSPISRCCWIRSSIRKAQAEIQALLAKQPGLVMPTYYRALLASQTGDTKAAWDLALTLPKEFVEVSSDVGLRVAQMAVDAGRRDAAADILGRVLGKTPAT